MRAVLCYKKRGGAASEVRRKEQGGKKEWGRSVVVSKVDQFVSEARSVHYRGISKQQ